MSGAFARANCGFYDPAIQHGGPDLEPHLRPNGKPRKALRRRRSGNSTDMMLKYDKNNPIKGIKQILTGFRVWAERHINECGGQRKYQHISNRMQNWMRIVFNLKISKNFDGGF